MNNTIARNSSHFEHSGIRDRNCHKIGFAVRVIALAIVLGEYTWTGAQILYNNRREILENVNIFRETVGSYFVYA